MVDPLRKARDYMHLGNYNAAKKIYKDLSDHDPEDERMHFQLGMCYLADSEFPLAKNQFETCINLNPNHLEALIELGDIYFKLGDDTSAVTCLQAACKLDGDNSRAHTYLARLYEHMENYSLAIVHYNRAIEESEASESPRHDLALAYVHNGELLEGYLLLQELLDEADLGLLWSKINKTEADIFDLNISGSEDYIIQLKTEMDKVEQLFYGEFEYSIMYTKTMLDALERFLNLSEEEIMEIRNEILVLSHLGAGFSEEKPNYELRSLKGQLSGFQLGCYLFTAEQLTRATSRMAEIYHRSFSQALVFLQQHN